VDGEVPLRVLATTDLRLLTARPLVERGAYSWTFVIVPSLTPGA
jgi:hypothetical protein